VRLGDGESWRHGRFHVHLGQETVEAELEGTGGKEGREKEGGQERAGERQKAGGTGLGQ
jgi:hypothetical protein